MSEMVVWQSASVDINCSRQVFVCVKRSSFVDDALTSKRKIEAMWATARLEDTRCVFSSKSSSLICPTP